MSDKVLVGEGKTPINISEVIIKQLRVPKAFVIESSEETAHLNNRLIGLTKYTLRCAKK